MRTVLTTARQVGPATLVLGRAGRFTAAVPMTWWKFVRRKPLAGFGSLLVLTVLTLALFAPLIATHPPKVIAGPSFQEPAFSKSLVNWGTDWLGRDVFSRIVYGARLSLYVGLLAPLWGTTLGALWGVLQGYWGGSAFDTVSQRLIEAKAAVPSLVLALTFMAVFGPSLENVIIAIGLGFIGGSARQMRAITLSLRQNQYVEAARAIGAPTWRIVGLHLIPNAFSLYLTLFSLQVGAAILAESGLSFLGLGAGPDVPSWGGMITLGTRQALAGGVPWLALFPGLAIAGTTYGFNLLGDGLRDVLDPRLKGGR